MFVVVICATAVVITHLPYNPGPLPYTPIGLGSIPIVPYGAALAVAPSYSAYRQADTQAAQATSTKSAPVITSGARL